MREIPQKYKRSLKNTMKAALGMSRAGLEASAVPMLPSCKSRKGKLLGILGVRNIPCAWDSVLYGS